MNNQSVFQSDIGGVESDFSDSNDLQESITFQEPKNIEEHLYKNQKLMVHSKTNQG